MNDKKKPINKRHERAARLHLWGPEGSVKMEGQVSKEAAGKMLAVFLDDAVRDKRLPHQPHPDAHQQHEQPGSDQVPAKPSERSSDP